MLSAALRRRLLAPTHHVLRMGFTSHVVRYASSYPPHSLVNMPALSPTMTSGGIGTWQKKPGDTIAPGDVLVEIETDKAQMDFEFQDEGVIAKLLKESGEKDVAVGTPIAVLVEEGTDISAFANFTIADAGGQAAAAQSKKKAEPTPASKPATLVTESSTPQQDARMGRVITVLEREALAARGIPIDIAHWKLETPKDIGRLLGKAAPGADFEDAPVSGMRKTIAGRLQESTQKNPHYFVTSSISVTKLLKLRENLNSSSNGKYKLSVNDFLIKAMSIACKKVPAVNSSWQGDTIRQYSGVDVSVAVATSSGLITPIIFGADKLGLEDISALVKELAKKARDGKLKPEEYQGGTISISNMGMNDAVQHFTAIINPPQAAILAVGTTQKVPVPVEGEDGETNVEWDNQIKVTASFDHKVVDGAVGAEWMRELKGVIENPLKLIL